MELVKMKTNCVIIITLILLINFLLVLFQCKQSCRWICETNDQEKAENPNHQKEDKTNE